jgi:serine/threonine protein phosphatase PrpC
MRITTYAVSRVGSRAHQDDAVGDADLVAGRCAVVADGAGGHRGGAIASKVATEAILLNLASARRWAPERLEEAIAAASRSVKKQQDAHPDMSEMSSTVVVLCLEPEGRKGFWTHVGDSRLFHFRRGVGELLTKDHSVLQSFEDAGVVLPGSAKPDRSVLYAAIGAEGDLKLVVGSKTDLRDGDAFLMCTDGVWDTVSLMEMEQLLQESTTVEEWVRAVTDRVEREHRESQDNYTALGVWLGSPEQTTITRI